MSVNPLQVLGELGQSVWYDNIHRTMLADGELARLVREDGLKGVTSNPTIFEKAITGSDAYDSAIADAVACHPDWDAAELFNHLAVADIRAAADVLRPVYDACGGCDGFVSIEVSPTLAHDADGTIREALKLYTWIDRPNVMIKVPATEAALPAIEALIDRGVPVNVTLLFSVRRYAAVAEAYIRGLESRARRGEPLRHVASVASFFVSRVDSAIDPRLATAHPELLGKAAIANARHAYGLFLELFDGPRFAPLRAQGAQVQRLLWASTSIKNPAYSDVLYVEELIGDRTVTTLPPATYDAYKDHGKPAPRLREGLPQAAETLARLEAAGIDLAAVTEQLEREGIDAFVTSYRNLIAALQSKAATVAAG
jgi:transaldolase, mycobacterial type